MKKLKCESCGANLVVEENNQFATCPYCKAKYKLNEDKTINIKIDDNIMDIVKGRVNMIKKFRFFAFIPFVIFIIVFIFIIIISFRFDMKDDNVTNNYEINNNMVNNIFSNLSKSQFNKQFEAYIGTKNNYMIENLLDVVIENNQKYPEKVVLVVYNDLNVTLREDIISIKHSLEQFKDYEILIDYDKEGYVNKVTIMDI